MDKLFVPYEIAMELKYKGYDESCFMYYRAEMDGSMQLWYHQDNNCLDAIGSNNSDNAKWVDCTAPLYQQAVDWLREKHNISIFIEIGTHEYSYMIYDVGNDKRLSGLETLKFNGTYHESLNKAIEESLKLI